jgi:TPP-dependent pyruvate/acetoin dehydrogenase alpha subunit
MVFENKYEELFYQALRIRLVEEEIAKIYPTDKIQSPVHLSIGQEAIAAGACYHLQNDDLIYTSYRSHAFFLAKGGDIKKMFAELFGKSTGSGKGKAGSMHLSSKETGVMGASAIVASTIPHGVGSAFASKFFNKGQVIVTAFGDGATEEGVYHESLNFASLHQLPVIFLCENNKLAIHSNLEVRHSYSLIEHAKSYRINTIRIHEGYDFLKIEEAFSKIVDQVRKTHSPYFVEIDTYRYKEHVGIADDHHESYRSLSEFESWKKNDPLMNKTDLVKKFSVVIQKEIEEAVKYAEESPYPEEEELLKDVI